MAFTEDKAFELIETAHQRGRLAHAFLIIGDEGTGKERLAARVIEMLNPPPEENSGMSLFGDEFEAEEKTIPALDDLHGDLVRVLRPVAKSRVIKVDAMRKFEQSFYVAAPPGKWKVGVIVNADRLNESSENAFLKTLEEPPPNCLLLLLTDSPNQLLPTILSRCVNLTLISASGETVINETQKELFKELEAVARQGLGDAPLALTLRGAFSRILAGVKTKITKRNDAALKEEVLKYKNTTDGEWLKGREEFYKGATESEYLGERERLLGDLIRWMGDVLRHKSGVSSMELPSESAHTAKVAQAGEVADLLRRIESLEELRQNLQTNAQEQLALEVGFLEVFA